MSDLESMAREAGLEQYADLRWCFDSPNAGITPEVLARFADLIRADERERCAKVCAPDGFDEGTADNDCAYAHADARRQCAAAIRAQ